jgi:hypothetical protein
VASEHQPQVGLPSTSTKVSPNEVIDLEEGQFTSEPDAKKDQTKAVDVNGLEPLASENQPQDSPSTVDSAKASVEIADLEEGQVACKDGAEDTQGGGDLQAEPLIVNGVDATRASDAIIDLEEGQVEDMDQTKAVDVNGLEPLASEHQPQYSPITVDSAKASIEITDLEEGQVACKAGAQDTQGGSDLHAEPLIVNRVDATRPSDEIIDLEEGQVEDMDLSDDDMVVVKRQSSDAPVQAHASTPAPLQSLHGAVSDGIDKGNGPGIVTRVHPSSSAFIDESRILTVNFLCVLNFYLLVMYSCKNVHVIRKPICFGISMNPVSCVHVERVAGSQTCIVYYQSGHC